MKRNVSQAQRDQWAAEKREKMNGAKELLASGLANIQTGEDWENQLRAFAVRGALGPLRFSFRNQMLLAMQGFKGGAVATYKGWQRYGRQVRKGEKGMMILQPLPFKKENSAGEEVSGIAFRTATVFGLSQTDGEPLPEVNQIPDLVSEEAFDGSVEALMQVARKLDVRDVQMMAPAEAATIVPNAKGWFSRLTKSIVIVDQGTRGEQFSVLVHEVAHAILHGNGEHHDDKGLKEFEAESTAFVVCHILGIDISARTFTYVAQWNKDEDLTKLLAKAGDRVMKAANTILDALLGDEDAEVEQTEEAA